MPTGKRTRPVRRSRRAMLPLLLAAVLAAGIAAAVLARQAGREPPTEITPGLPDPPPGTVSEPEPEPEPKPAPEPEPGPDPAERLLAAMTLREKVCQLFIVYPSALTGAAGETEAGEAVGEGLAAFPVGGLLYDRSNMISQDQVRGLLAGTQSRSKIPLLFTCDEEGGRVNRLMGAVGTPWVGPMLDYKDRGPDTARDNARTIASGLLSCGFNLDLAPVADVWSNPANTVIGDRAYSDDFQQAAELVAAAVEGFHEGGTACTLKHFPGHGDTSADSHYGSVYVRKTLDELRQAELVPFRAGIGAGADAVMLGHLILDWTDGQPALLSYAVVTELLREELGFGGVVMTDSLQMRAITDHYGSGELAVGAVKAGVDVLLCPQDLEEAVDALVRAAEEGEVSAERLDGSVLRVLRLKQAYGLLDGMEPTSTAG